MSEEIKELKTIEDFMAMAKKCEPTKWRRFCWWLGRMRKKFSFITHENFRVAIPRHLKKHRTEWVDRDAIMAHTMFEIMCEFVEKEFLPNNGLGKLKWDGETLYVQSLDDNYKPTGKWEVVPVIENVGEWNEYSREHEYELMRLYDWWTKDYPELMETDWYDFPIGYGKNSQVELSDDEEKEVGAYSWEEIDINEKLLTLLEIRGSLWT